MKLFKLNQNQIIFILINIICIYHMNSVYSSPQIIQIYSSNQIINILTDTITFETNVILKSKYFKLHADKIIIKHNHDTHNISMIKAFGTPVILYHIPESGDKISAQALMIQYNIIHNAITLTGQARIEQSGNSIQSDNIIYSINKKQIQATSNTNSNTITTLLKQSI